MCVDENGEELDGDCCLALIAQYLKKKGELKNDTVVATVMSNIGLNEFVFDNEINLVQTKVGDRYVLERMLEGDFVLGGEQSGHIILKNYNNTGDRNFNFFIFDKNFIRKKYENFCFLGGVSKVSANFS